MEFNNVLLGLRGWAFLQVWTEHYLHTVMFIPLGIFGVNIFFVLSSFLLTSNLYSNLKKHSTMKIFNYVCKRIFRIYPLLIIALTIELLMSRLNLKDILLIASLISCKGIYWTIYLEMRSYFILPLLVWMVRKIQNILLRFLLFMITMVFFLTYHIYVTFISDNQINIKIVPEHEEDISANILFFRFFPLFFMGFSAAIIKDDYFGRHKNNISVQPINNQRILQILTINIFSVLIFLSHILFLCIMFFIINYTKYGKMIKIPIENVSLYFSIAYSILILLILKKKDSLIDAVIGNKIFQFLGEISYPGYLFNIIIREFSVKIFKIENTNYKLMVIASVILIVFSYLMHISIENLFIKFSKNMCKYENFNQTKNISEPKHLYMDMNGSSQIENIDMEIKHISV